jgi:hypothetical protein
LSDNNRPFLVNIGFGNYVVGNKVIAIIKANSAPKRRLAKYVKSDGYFIDSTDGRRTRSYIIMDSKHIVSSALQSETIALVRFNEEGVTVNEITEDASGEYA